MFDKWRKENLAFLLIHYLTEQPSPAQSKEVTFSPASQKTCISLSMSQLTFFLVFYSWLATGSCGLMER